MFSVKADLRFQDCSKMLIMYYTYAKDEKNPKCVDKQVFKDFPNYKSIFEQLYE